MYLIYSAVLRILALLYFPVFLVRKVWRAGYPLALGQRLGLVRLPPAGERFWIHAVSVGEVMAAVPLVQALRTRWPEVPVVVSTVTGTGQRVARARLGEAAAVFAFPLDFPGATRRAVRRVRPRCFVALETEIWPNLLRALARAGIPAALANGRISDRSYRRYCWVRPLFCRVLAQIGLFAMQSDEDARRIISLGAGLHEGVEDWRFLPTMGAARHEDAIPAQVEEPPPQPLGAGGGSRRLHLQVASDEHHLGPGAQADDPTRVLV